MRADAGAAEHRVPAPQRLFPERLAPRELTVVHHPLVTAPDGVHEDVDAAGLVQYPPQRPFHLRIVAVIARNDDRPAVSGASGSTGREHARTEPPELARHAAADPPAA